MLHVALVRLLVQVLHVVLALLLTLALLDLAYLPYHHGSLGQQWQLLMDCLLPYHCYLNY